MLVLLLYDMLCLHTYRGDFSSTPGGSAIIFENRDSNNSNNYGRIKCMTVNDTDYGDNDGLQVILFFKLQMVVLLDDRMIITGRGAVGIGTMNPRSIRITSLSFIRYGYTLRIQSWQLYTLISVLNSSWFHFTTNVGTDFIFYKDLVGSYSLF